MADASTVTVDGSVFAFRMQQLKKYVGKELAAQVLPYEAKTYMRQVMKRTPPYGRGDAGAIGRKAVKRDISRTMRPISSEIFTRSRKLKARFKQLEEEGDFLKMFQFIKAVNKKGGPLIRNKGMAPFSSGLHTRAQQKNGRVSATSWPYLIPRKQDQYLLMRYIKEKQGHVGWTVGGWRMALIATGEPVPPWSKTSAPGGYISILDGDLPFIQISNWSNMSASLSVEARKILDGRARAMATKVLRLMDGKAVNVGFATVLPI